MLKDKIYKGSLIIFFLLAIILDAHSQQITVGGNVSDSTGANLPGVNVKVKGTTTGTYTRSKGHYNLQVPSLQDTLVFSFVGYQTLQVPINGRNEINIKMAPQAISGQEMVVIGYGTETKQQVTGSVSQISTQDISRTTPTAKTTDILSGKLPGVRVRTTSSEPGHYNSTGSFDIRGFGNPLIIINGVPSTDRDFKRLDPNDIKNISVLKDASAAIYGVRAANGVILVTTKTGKAGEVQISYKGQGGWSTPTNYPQQLNAYQFATLSDERDINNGDIPSYSKKEIQQYKNGSLPGTDWYGLVTRKYTPQTQHHLSVSGGTDKATYFVSIGAVVNNGIWENGSLNNKKYTFRSNISVHVTKDLDAKILLSGVQDNEHDPIAGPGNILNQPLLLKPTLPAYANNNPKYLRDSGVNPSNPLALINPSISGYHTWFNRKLNGIASLNYSIPFITGLQAKLRYSYNPEYSFIKTWSKQYPLYTYDNATDTYTAHPRQIPTTLSKSAVQSYDSDLQASLHYKKSVAGSHNLDALFLFEKYQEGSDNFNGSTEFYLSAIDHLYAGNANNPQINSNVTIPSNREGFVGRLKYNYQKKYFAQFSFRYDGSSKFAEGHRWGFFPGFSAGWLLSDEPFIKNISAISNLKLRASWGETGDDRASNFQYLSGYTYPGATYIFDNVVRGFSPRGLPNRNLTWYTAKTANIGLDIGLWDGKLNLTADVFRRNRTGLLATRNLQLPASLGASLPQENLNSDRTEGFEVEIGHTNHLGDFNYNVGGNVSLSRTKIMYVERSPSPNAYENWRNNTAYRWNDIIWGYKAVGQFTSQGDINNWPIQGDNQGNRPFQPGDIKYEDYNNDGIIDGKDMQPLYRGSNNLPLINFGMTMGMEWKNFDLNILLQGGAGLYVNQNGGYFGYPLRFNRNGLLTDFMNRWHHEDLFDPTSSWVPGKYPSTRKSSSIASSANHYNSTFWFHKDPYLRVKSLQLGYTLPATLGIAKQARIFVSGHNVLTWSKVSYIDPEHPNSTGYPIEKTFNVGLNVTF